MTPDELLRENAALRTQIREVHDALYGREESAAQIFERNGYVGLAEWARRLKQLRMEIAP